MRAPWRLLILAAGLPPLACASVLGFEDVTVDENPGGDGGASSATSASGPSTSQGTGGGATTGTSGQGGQGGCGDTDGDAANCGACGHDCLGGKCEGGQCQPVLLASGLNHPRGIAVDGTKVYVAEEGGNVIRSLGKVDGQGGELIASSAVGVSAPFGIAVDDDGLYFTNSGSNLSVMRCPKTAPCSPVTLDPPASCYFPAHILVRTSFAYWMDAYANTIEKADKATGSGKVVVTQTSNGYEGGEYAWFDLDDQYVYWNDRTPGNVRRRPLSGGAPVTLYSGQDMPSSLVLADGTLYWANAGYNAGEGSILSSPPEGAPSPTIVAVGQKYPAAIVVDASYVYWLQEGTEPMYQDGGLSRCAVGGCGGLPEVLVTDLGDPRALAQDAEALYYTTWGDGEVWKLAK